MYHPQIPSPPLIDFYTRKLSGLTLVLLQTKGVVYAKEQRLDQISQGGGQCVCVSNSDGHQAAHLSPETDEHTQT